MSGARQVLEAGEGEMSQSQMILPQKLPPQVRICDAGGAIMAQYFMLQKGNEMKTGLQ